MGDSDVEDSDLAGVDDPACPAAPGQGAGGKVGADLGNYVVGKSAYKFLSLSGAMMV